MTRRASLLRPILLAVFLMAAMVMARALHLGERIGELREWILSLGSLGPAIYLLIYIAAVVLAVPGSLISIMAGVMFGSFLGVMLVSVGSTVGAGLAFLLARHWARDAVAERLQHNPKFHKLDQMTAEHGSIIVAITRLVPLFPFNLLNYGFGLTSVPFRIYLFWSWICMLPGTVLYVVGADTLTQTLREGKISWPLVGVLVLMLGAILVLVHQAKKRLKSKPEEREHV